MHTTKQNRALDEAAAAQDSPFFTMASSLSERALITPAPYVPAEQPAASKGTDRAIDVILALSMLALLLPVMILVAAGVALTSPGPVIFKQLRVGQNGRIFGCYKFRTMETDAEQRLARLLEARPELRKEWNSSQKLNRDPRVTRLGRFLRQSSLDELPQLINVLRGEMSLVGPRPIVPSEMTRYGRHIVNYMSVKPGLTGLWQVTGRNCSTYRRRIAADVLYARSKCLRLDLKILIMTVPAVLTGRGSC